MKKRLLILILGLNLVVIINAQTLWIPGANVGNNTTNDNIGIGATAPELKLAIYGNDGVNTPTFSIYTKQVGTGSFQQIALINPTGSNNNDGMFKLLDNGIVKVKISANNERGGDTYFNGGGNVGIGTTTPVESLHIMTGSSYTTITSLFSGGGNVLSQGPEPAFVLSQDLNSSGLQTGAETSVGGMGFVFINSSDYNNLRIGTQTNHKVIFRTYNIDRMTINNEGNLGIGTTAPESKLAIYGNDGINTPTFSIYTKQVGTGSFQQIALINPTGSNNNDGMFKLLDNGIVRVKIAANNDRGGDTYFNGGGNIGIGTTNPQNKLDVNGTIRAKEIKATLDGWSDYVFDEDYNLMLLNEVENYIKTNKKLPEIPSANEAKTDGVNLGEMNAKLLQKIEELTLYVIEQKKQLEQQNIRIQILENELKTIKTASDH